MPRAAKTTRQAGGDTVITVSQPANGTSPAISPEPEKKDFWEQVADVPESGWGTDYMIYVYRLDPPGRSSGYIGKETRPIERDEFAQTYGGYRYRLMLNKNGKMIAATEHNVAMPPKAIGTMDPAFLTNAAMASPTETVLQQFGGILRDQIEKQNPADKNTIELLMTASKNAMEIMRTQAPNPMDAVRLMMEMQRAQTQPENETTKLLMAKIIEKAFTPPPPAETNVTQQIDSVLRIAEALGFKPGGGGGSRGPDLGSMLVSKIPDLIQGAVSLMTRYESVTANNRRIAELQRGAPITVQPVAAQPAAPAGAAPAASTMPPPVAFRPLEREPISAAPARPLTMQDVPDMPGVIADDDPRIFERMKHKVVQGILLGVPPESVIDFISLDNPVLMTLLRESSEADLKKFFTEDPVLSQALAKPDFDAFIHEAVKYMQENRDPSGTPSLN